MFINRFIAIVIITISGNDYVVGSVGFLHTNINEFTFPVWHGKNWAYGCEFNGNDLINVRSETTNCARFCIENANCTHYVWSDHNNGTCWLKRNGANRADAVQSSNSSTQCGIISGSRNITWTDADWAHRCDFKGNDLSNVPLIPDLCSARCVNTLGCTHYVWTDDNNGTCWLKQYGATKLDAFLSSNPLAVCGVVKGGRNIAWKGNNWAVGCDFIRNNLTSFPSIREDCRRLCVYMSGCTHYTWTNHDKGTCWMKENGATKMDAFYISDSLAECGLINFDYIAWNEDRSAPGCDFIGNDLRSQPSTKENCRDLCASTRSCTHFTWSAYFNGTCWMKKNGAHTSDAIRISDPSLLCGIITDSGDVNGYNFSWNANSIAADCDFNANDLHIALQRTVDDCRSLCAVTPKCTHYVWGDYDGGTCWMKSNKVTKSDAIPSLSPGMFCGIIVDSVIGGNITWNENNSAVGCEFNGNSLTRISSNKELCVDLCRLTTGCTHYSWTSTTDDGGTCSMKKNGASRTDAIPSTKHSTVCGIIGSGVNQSEQSNNGIGIGSDVNQCEYCKDSCSKNVETSSVTVGSVDGYRLAIQTRDTEREFQPCIKPITKPAINLVLLFDTMPKSFLNQETDAILKVALREPNFLIIYEDLKDVEFEVVSPSVDGGKLVANHCSSIPNDSNFIQNLQNFDVNQTAPERDWAQDIIHSIKYLHDSVTELDLASSGLNELSVQLFVDFRHLEELKLSNNKLEVLMPGTFKNQQKLHSLSLDRNRLQNVTKDAFQGLSSLRFLDLSCNSLGVNEIEANSFGSMEALIELNLSHNNLTSISGGVFRGLDNLKIIRINDNYLKTIDSDAFSHTSNLENVYLGTNQLSFTDTHHNSLSPFQHLYKLKELYLQHNKITNILPDWRKIPELRILSLRSNKLTTLNYEDFNFTSSAPVVLNLEDNHISVNISDTIDEINNVIVVLNRIDCCNVNVSNFMAYVINDTSRIRFAITNLSCSSANSETASRSINEFNFRTMACPLEECPSNCRCSKKPFDNALIINCSYANLRQPPNIAYNGSYSQVELYIDHNELLALPSMEHDDAITVIQASHNLLQDIYTKNLPRNLRVLNVSHNQIKRLDESVFDELNNRGSLEDISLGNNPWLCDCSREAEKLVTFVKQNEKWINDLKEIKCPEQQVDIYGVNDQFVENICLQLRNKILLSLIAALIVLIAIASVLYAKHQQTIKIWLYAHNVCLCWVDEDDLDKDKVYDAFVSYSHLDEDFAMGTIVAQLESGTPKFKTCVHERDWLAGGFILESIAQSIANSRRTIIILSQNFLTSMWGRTEFQYAHDNAIAEKRVRVIIIIYGDIGNIDDLDPDLQSYLRTNTYVRWGEKWFWEKVRYALGHKT